MSSVEETLHVFPVEALNVLCPRRRRRRCSLILCFSVRARCSLTSVLFLFCLHRFVSSCVSLSTLPCCLYLLCLPTEDSSDEENSAVLNRFTRKFAPQLTNNFHGNGIFFMAAFCQYIGLFVCFSIFSTAEIYVSELSQRTAEYFTCWHESLRESVW